MEEGAKGALQGGLKHQCSPNRPAGSKAMSPQLYLGLTLPETRVLGEGQGGRYGDCPLSNRENR